MNPARLRVLLLGQVASPECVCDQMPRPDRRGYGEANKDDKINTIICDAVNGKIVAVPRAVMAAGGIMQGARGGVDIPKSDVDRVKSHLARYYRKMDRTPPWED